MPNTDQSYYTLDIDNVAVAVTRGPIEIALTVLNSPNGLSKLVELVDVDGCPVLYAVDQQTLNVRPSNTEEIQRYGDARYSAKTLCELDQDFVAYIDLCEPDHDFQEAMRRSRLDTLVSDIGANRL